MEVRQQGVHHEELRSRDEEQARLERTRGDPPAMFASGGLERPHARRPDRDDPSPFRFRPADGFGRFRGNDAALRVHPVVFDPFGLHRLESADPDVKRHGGDGDATGPERFEEPGTQVEPCGRRCNGARLPGVNGLVLLGVPVVGDAPFTVDVRGKRRRPDPRQSLLERSPRKGDPVVPRSPFARHDAREALAEFERLSRFRPASRFREAVPGVGAFRLPDEEELRAPPLRVAPEEAGGNDAGVVHHQEVSRQEERREVRDTPVPDLAAGPVERHEPRGAARRRALGDRFRGEVEVEVGDVHGWDCGRFAVRGPFRDALTPGALACTVPPVRTMGEANGTYRKLRLMDPAGMSRVIARMAREVVEAAGGVEGFALVGIRTRGVPLARRLALEIEKTEGARIPVGLLDITLYRDDLTTVASSPVLKRTDISFPVETKTIVLCDDVLYTGRTVRAAIDAILDFGRPRRIVLAVLVDRGRRELPIEAQLVGKKIATSATEVVSVTFKETDGEDDVWLLDRHAAKAASRTTGAPKVARKAPKKPAPVKKVAVRKAPDKKAARPVAGKAAPKGSGRGKR